MVDSGIILKIQKLLALASSSNENEAQAAMMKAQEMLAKYKLSMKDVQSKHPESKAVKRCTAVTFTKAAWKGRLASVIADNFCCYMYLLTARSHQVVFMGLPEDAETAASVFEYAVEYITGRVRQLRREYYRLGESTKGLENDYAQGFISGLSQKYEEQKQKNQEWALVLVKPQAVVEAYKSMKWDGKPVNTDAYFTGFKTAYEQGQQDGNDFVMVAGHIGG